MDGLNLGNLCKLMRELKPRKFWCPPGSCGDTWMAKTGVISQSAAVELVYSMVYPWDQVDSYAIVAVPSHANGVLQNKIAAKKEVREKAQHFAIQLIGENFRKLYFDELSSDQRHAFVQKLRELVRQTDFGFDPLNLRFYMDYTYDDTEELNALSCRFAGNAIYWCILGPNTEEAAQEVISGALHPGLPEDIAGYDPYSRDYYKKNSTALRFELIDTTGGAETVSCSNHERTVERIESQGLVITDIQREHGLIRLYYDGSLCGKVTLRRLEREDIPTAVTFVRTYLREFRPKYSWGTRTLAQMAKDGLETEKWTAHAYFDHKGRMISYLDYKLRSDGEVELGVQLTDEDWRGRKLATGLVNFHRTKFMNNRLYVSTFEENGAMRRVLETNGFSPKYFFDAQTGIVTHIIRERIDPSDPENKALWTNSVYYFADSLLSTIKIDK